MKKYPYLAAICLMMQTGISLAQNNAIGISYDEAGNRIRREPITVTQTSSNLIGQADSTGNKPASEEINALNQNKVNVYPNPADEIVYIAVSSADAEVRYTLYDVSGKAVLSGKEHANTIPLNLSGMAPGMYFITVVAGNSETRWQVVKR